VRIIGGLYRGKKIQAPESLPVRPTTDFAKTGLFNILLNHYDLEKIRVLDLFAGTGSISYELLSRGCSEIDIVDRNKACVQFIRQTMEKLRAPSGIRVHYADALTFLGKDQQKYDVIFADPPFDMEITQDLVHSVHDLNKLDDDGLLITEHQSLKNYSGLPGFYEMRKYGNVSFSFFNNY
jgi:16S rRNA (guanine966-N2)-methyltransferase